MKGLEGTLRGVRVLDLTRLLPGPFASMILGDLGADVIKVEDPKLGDYARYYQPFVGSMGAFFASINRNKRSVVVDLKSVEGSERFAALLGSADVVLESFRPGVLERLGWGRARMEREFPDVVVCSISGYGQTGEARDEAGHDINYIARAGLLHGTGTREGGVVTPGFQVADIAGGALYAVSGVLAALFRRERGEGGVWLDVSMTEGALSLMIPMLGMVRAGYGELGPGSGMLGGGAPCYGVYQARCGGWMALGALEPKFWGAFCAVVGLEDVVGEGLATGERGVEVRARVAEVFRGRSREEWVKVLEGMDCCCVPVRDAGEVMEDGLWEERGVFFEVEGREGEGAWWQVATPLTPAERGDFRPPPRHGEHTEEVFAELGISV